MLQKFVTAGENNLSDRRNSLKVSYLGMLNNPINIFIRLVPAKLEILLGDTRVQDRFPVEQSLISIDGAPSLRSALPFVVDILSFHFLFE